MWKIVSRFRFTGYVSYNRNIQVLLRVGTCDAAIYVWCRNSDPQFLFPSHPSSCTVATYERRQQVERETNGHHPQSWIICHGGCMWRVQQWLIHLTAISIPSAGRWIVKSASVNFYSVLVGAVLVWGLGQRRGISFNPFFPASLQKEIVKLLGCVYKVLMWRVWWCWRHGKATIYSR